MRKLATASFSFTFAIFLSRYLLPYDWLLIISAAAAGLSLLGLCFYGKTRQRIIIILISACIGLGWSWSFTAVFISPSQDFHEQTMSVSAVITSYPSERAVRGYRVDGIILNNNGPDIGARIYYYNDTALKPGDVVEFTGRFRSTENSDSEMRNEALSARGAFLTAFVSGAIDITDSEGQLRFLPLRISEAIAEMVYRLYPDDIAHFMQALLVGKRDNLFADTALNASLSASGIVHIVSISGMHVSFLMGFLALMVKNNRLFPIIGIPVLFLFMAMTGFTPSVTRAGIMQIFLICAPIFRRERDSITSLSAALIVLMFLNPYSIASIGLQLSFTATVGIIVITPRINSGVSDLLRTNKINKNKYIKAIITFITSSLATTIGALILTVPLTAIHFGYVSLIAPLSNLLTIFAVSLAFPLGLISALLAFLFYPLGEVAAFPVALASRYIITIARTLSNIPYAIIYSSNSLLMFWLAYIYILFISMPLLKARLRQYIYPVCLAAAMLFIVILLSPLISESESKTMTVLDVGQGLGIVFTSGEHTAVVDCGSISGQNAGAITHEYLVSKGRTVVDLLILTHFHADHINGVEFLLSRINVKALAIPDPEGSFVAEDIIELARRRGADIIYVTQTLFVSLGEMSFVLYPPVGFGDENERGVTILSQGDFLSLTTGDMNSSSERALLRFAEIPDIDVLIVGHHGSRHSTSEELLEAVSPEIAIISVGRNSFGHPSKETIERLEQYGVTVYRTDLMGHVRIG